MFIYMYVHIFYLGFSKKLDVLGRKFPDISDWKPSLINHMYWVAASTPDAHPDILEARWTSLLDHIVDLHKNCYHDALAGAARIKDWLDIGN